MHSIIIYIRIGNLMIEYVTDINKIVGQKLYRIV